MEEGDAFNIKTVITQNKKLMLSDAICTGSAVVHSLAAEQQNTTLKAIQRGLFTERKWLKE